MAFLDSRPLEKSLYEDQWTSKGSTSLPILPRDCKWVVGYTEGAKE